MGPSMEILVDYELPQLRSRSVHHWIAAVTSCHSHDIPIHHQHDIILYPHKICCSRFCNPFEKEKNISIGDIIWMIYDDINGTHYSSIAIYMCPLKHPHLALALC